MTLLLNCDLGESASIDSENVDACVMPFIDQASIACGFHAGDGDVMAKTITYALENERDLLFLVDCLKNLLQQQLMLQKH